MLTEQRRGWEWPGALFTRRAESGRVARWSPMLAQRAAWEGPRWTRAVEAQSGPILNEITSKLGAFPSNQKLTVLRDSISLGHMEIVNPEPIVCVENFHL